MDNKRRVLCAMAPLPPRDALTPVPANGITKCPTRRAHGSRARITGGSDAPAPFMAPTSCLPGHNARAVTLARAAGIQHRKG